MDAWRGTVGAKTCRRRMKFGAEVVWSRPQLLLINSHMLHKLTFFSHLLHPLHEDKGTENGRVGTTKQDPQTQPCGT